VVIMSSDDWAEYAPATRAVRAGHIRTAECEHAEPIFATSSFCFASAREAAESFSGTRRRNVYSRFTNPTVRTFQERLAALEGGQSCIATASGWGPRCCASARRDVPASKRWTAGSRPPPRQQTSPSSPSTCDD